MISAEARKVVADLAKKFGGEKIVLGNDIKPQTTKFPTGSLTYDYILGGGYPANQWNELIGEPSHGKTTIALKTVAANQDRDPDFLTVWVAAEEWVPSYAEMVGVDASRVIVIETNIMEEAFEAAIQFTESQSVDAVVIDSLPALVPNPEIDKDMTELTVGRHAMLTNKFFRKVGQSMKRSLVDEERPVLGLMVNQYRYKIGTMYGDPRTTPGGEGKNYAYFTRSEVKRDEWIEIGSGTNKERIGQRIRARTIKNKVAPPYRSAYFDYYFAEGGPCPPGSIDTGKEIAAMALLLGIVEKKGGWYYYQDHKWQGRDSMVESLREEIDLAEQLSKEVFR